MRTPETVRSALRRFSLLGMTIASIGLVSAQLACDSNGYRSPTAVAPPPASPAPAPPAPPTPGANLSGAWTGSYTSLADGIDQLTDATFPSTSTIEQSGASVTARFGVIVPDQPTHFYPFVGTLDGLSLRGTIYDMRATGEVEGNRLTIHWGYNRWDLRR